MTKWRRRKVLYFLWLLMWSTFYIQFFFDVQVCIKNQQINNSNWLNVHKFCISNIFTGADFENKTFALLLQHAGEACGHPLTIEKNTQDWERNIKQACWKNELPNTLTTTVHTYSYVLKTDHRTKLTPNRAGPIRNKGIFTEYFKLKVAISITFCSPKY